MLFHFRTAILSVFLMISQEIHLWFFVVPAITSRGLHFVNTLLLNILLFIFHCLLPSEFDNKL